MRYICTLLKDLPEVPTGTVFRVLGENGKITIIDRVSVPTSIINNSEWVKKDLDETCLTELKCKSCGNTKMLLEARKANYDYDDGVYFYKMKLVGVCPCGCENEFITFTTHTRVHY